MYRIKVGCQLSYAAPVATPAVFIVEPPPHARQMLMREMFLVQGTTAPTAFVDRFDNRCQRAILAPGDSVVRYEAVVVAPPDADAVRPMARQVPPEELPAALLRYTLPSRYAETDKLLGFAWDNFARLPAGWERARGICDWVHREIAYKRGVSLPHWSAADTITRRQGVCRDRAHVVVALCRAFNLPARYAVSYLPDIDVANDGLPMDFHAYAEVWLEGGWQVFDPHDLAPRKGRVFIASGLDAADVAFATLYGGARLTDFQVWADPINERGAAVDLTTPARAVFPPLTLVGAGADEGTPVAASSAQASAATSPPPLAEPLSDTGR